MITNDSRRGMLRHDKLVGSATSGPPFSVTLFNDVLNDDRLLPGIAWPAAFTWNAFSPLLGMRNEIYHSPTMAPAGNGDLKAQA